MISSFRPWILSGMVCSIATVFVIDGTAAEPSAPKTDVAANVSGREIFLREWLPNDPRSHGGDGLGPVFNDTSCVSCHNQGGIGGGGAEAKNVVVITAVRTNFNRVQNASAVPRTTPAAPSQSIRPAPQVASPQIVADEQERKMLLKDLKSLHPGLVTARSVVLHKSGTDPKYAAWRDKALGLNSSHLMNRFIAPIPQAVAVPPTSAGGGFFTELAAQAQQSAIMELQPPMEMQLEKGRSLFSRIALVIPVQEFAGGGGGPGQAARSVAAIPTQRNSIALFGAGLIDAIPIEVIEAAAAKTHEDFPEISGRIARLKEGQIGRFGWKAQKANLHDFTMTACAVELGLNVPDHPQAGVPNQPNYQPAGFDLDRDECLQLVQFLKDLPAPTRTDTSNPAIAKELQLGELAFAKIGCAACHVADMGEVRGVFSDLLVHDMGSELGDSGSYGVFQPLSSGSDADDPLAGLLNQGDQPLNRVLDGSVVGISIEEPIPDKMIGAARQEWRTAPLWGVRDSAPYMHDGRAGSLEQAIAFHGGEAQLSANRYFRLPPEERARVLMFLRSLVAPEQVASAVR